MTSREVKDYVYGLHGKPPASIDPELDKAKEATKDIAWDIGDVLIYALYPTAGIRFLRWKMLSQPPAAAGSRLLDSILGIR